MDQNFILEEIKSSLKSGNTCYHSVQNIFVFHFVSTNLKIKIYKILITPVVL